MQVCIISLYLYVVTYIQIGDMKNSVTRKVIWTELKSQLEMIKMGTKFKGFAIDKKLKKNIVYIKVW